MIAQLIVILAIYIVFKDIFSSSQRKLDKEDAAKWREHTTPIEVSVEHNIKQARKAPVVEIEITRGREPNVRRKDLN